MFFRLSQQNRCGSRFFMPQGTQAIPKLHPTKTRILWEKYSGKLQTVPRHEREDSGIQIPGAGKQFHELSKKVHSSF